MLGYIPDGYTRQGYIEAVPNLYDGLRFVYRPAVIEERSAFQASLGEKGPENNRKSAEMAAKRIVSWTATFNDQPLPIAPQVLLRFTPKLHERILGIILGYDGGDDDPQASESDRRELKEDKKEADAIKTTVGQVREMKAAKN